MPQQPQLLNAGLSHRHHATATVAAQISRCLRQAATTLLLNGTAIRGLSIMQHFGKATGDACSRSLQYTDEPHQKHTQSSSAKQCSVPASPQSKTHYRQSHNLNDRHLCRLLIATSMHWSDFELPGLCSVQQLCSAAGIPACRTCHAGTAANLCPNPARAQTQQRTTQQRVYVKRSSASATAQPTLAHILNSAQCNACM
jgi:hypothetical protein